MKTVQRPSVRNRIPARLLLITHRLGKAIGALLYETFCAWQNDKAPTLAAALAFYTLFSLTPVLLVVIAIAGLVFGPEAAEIVVVERTRNWVGEGGTEVILAILGNAADSPLGITTSAVVMLLGATVVFVHLQSSLNTIWEVMPMPGRPIRNLLKARFLSFLVVLGIGFSLLLLLTTSTALSALNTVLRERVGAPSFLIRFFNYLVSPVVLTVLITLIYKILPDAKVRWRDVWVGAAVTSLLFTVGNSLIGYYLATTSLRSLYGAASSLVIFLLWVYVSAQIFFFGAEFTHVYARKHGAPIIPSENAVRFSREIHFE